MQKLIDHGSRRRFATIRSILVSLIAVAATALLTSLTAMAQCPVPELTPAFISRSG
jgi:hypothetical protein